MSEGKGWAKYVAIGCTVVVLLGACALGLMYYSCNAAYQAATAPSDTAAAFFADLRAGRVAQAYERMDEAYRTENDLDAFRALVSSHPVLTQNAAVTFNEHFLDTEGATLGGYLLFDGRPIPVQVRLHEGPDGAYVIEGMQVDDTAGAPLDAP